MSSDVSECPVTTDTASACSRTAAPPRSSPGCNGESDPRQGAQTRPRLRGENPPDPPSDDALHRDRAAPCVSIRQRFRRGRASASSGNRRCPIQPFVQCRLLETAMQERRPLDGLTAPQRHPRASRTQGHLSALCLPCRLARPAPRVGDNPETSANSDPRYRYPVQAAHPCAPGCGSVGLGNPTTPTRKFAFFALLPVCAVFQIRAQDQFTPVSWSSFVQQFQYPFTASLLAL